MCSDSSVIQNVTGGNHLSALENFCSLTSVVHMSSHVMSRVLLLHYSEWQRGGEGFSPIWDALLCSLPRSWLHITWTRWHNCLKMLGQNREGAIVGFSTRERTAKKERNPALKAQAVTAAICFLVSNTEFHFSTVRFRTSLTNNTSRVAHRLYTASIWPQSCLQAERRRYLWP